MTLRRHRYSGRPVIVLEQVWMGAPQVSLQPLNALFNRAVLAQLTLGEVDQQVDQAEVRENPIVHRVLQRVPIDDAAELRLQHVIEAIVSALRRGREAKAPASTPL